MSASLQIKRLSVQFPVRAQAWVVGQVPSWWHMRGNHTLIFFSLSFSLPAPPLCLKINKILKEKNTLKVLSKKSRLQICII